MQKISGYIQTVGGACLFLVAFSVMVPLTRATLWAGTPIGSNFVLAYLAGGAGLWLAIRLSFRGVGQTEPTAATLLARDSRPPVLILRPGAEETPAATARAVDPLTRPAETAVHQYLNGIGPVIAALRPGERPHAPGGRLAGGGACRLAPADCTLDE